MIFWGLTNGWIPVRPGRFDRPPRRWLRRAANGPTHGSRLRKSRRRERIGDETRTSTALELARPIGLAPTIAPTDWVPVVDQPVSTDTQLTDVVWTGARFVAAGTVSTFDPVFVDSIDGRTWHVQRNMNATVRVQGMAVGPNGVIAVELEGSDARSWVSRDGLSWTAAPITRALQPGLRRGIRMNGVAWTGTAWLAVGEEDTDCDYECDSASSDRANVWSSVDGLDWTRAPEGASLARSAMNDVTRGGPRFVAVGAAPNRAATTQVAQHAVVWTSIDGRTWSRAPDASVFHAPAGTDQTFGDAMNAIAADGDAPGRGWQRRNRG